MTTLLKMKKLKPFRKYCGAKREDKYIHNPDDPETNRITQISTVE